MLLSQKVRVPELLFHPSKFGGSVWTHHADEYPQTREPTAMPMPKLLCLHGRRSNAEVTEMQCQGVLELDKVAALHYLDAPFESTAFDKDIGGGRSWVIKDEPPETKQETLRQSLIHIVRKIASDGPFDGVYGFSQGAAIASLLCEPAVHGALGLTAPPFRFILLVCGADYDKAFGAGVAQEFMGACAAQEDAARQLQEVQHPPAAASRSSLLQLPSLHLMGEKDDILASSQELTQRYAQPQLLFHKSGHAVPAMELCTGEGVQLTNRLRSFIQKPGYA